MGKITKILNTKKAAAKTAEILSLLDEINKNNILLVSNIMMTNPHSIGGKFNEKLDTSKEILEEFEKNNLFQMIWSEKTGICTQNITYMKVQVRNPEQ